MELWVIHVLIRRVVTQRPLILVLNRLEMNLGNVLGVSYNNIGDLHLGLGRLLISIL